MTVTSSHSKLSKDMLWKLKILTFTSGAVVMALEISASRILTPVFGSTIYTWGSLIGIILSGLSLGYFLGGKTADNHPKFEKNLWNSFFSWTVYHRNTIFCFFYC